MLVYGQRVLMGLVICVLCFLLLWERNVSLHVHALLDYLFCKPFTIHGVNRDLELCSPACSGDSETLYAGLRDGVLKFLIVVLTVGLYSML